MATSLRAAEGKEELVLVWDALSWGRARISGDPAVIREGGSYRFE